MGFNPGCMTHSHKLRTAILRILGEEHASEACDMTSTAGYDNDGSIGPEMIDNGVGLGLEAREYHPKAIIFYALGEPGLNATCYYQYGIDEDDATRRLRETS